jgi:hypothetical protein
LSLVYWWLIAKLVWHFNRWQQGSQQLKRQQLEQQQY